ncbi:MAG: response regulator transcription factor [Acidimicrobiales bacterium]
MSSGRRARVLVVEDDADVRRLIVRAVGNAGFDVDEADDALGAMARLGARRPDLLLLDVVLPDVDGFEFLTRIRKDSDVPVILVTGRASEGERIRGLRLGADDYVVKPFSPGELVARVESVLRRAKKDDKPPPAASATPATSASKAVLRFPGLEIDRRSREVVLNAEVVPLTSKEFDLLAFLASSPRQVFTRNQLLRQVWESSADWQDDATVTEHVRRIRRKLEADPDHPRWIVTVRGAGYRFEP